MKQQPKKLKSLISIWASIIALSSLLLLSGCGSDDSSSAGASDPNGEGVRAEVRKAIETTHPDSAKERAALFQYARVMEKILADAGDKQLSIQHANESNRANDCLWYTFGTVSAYGAAQDNLKSVILASDERNTKYLLYNKEVDYVVFKEIPFDQRADACDIHPSTL